MVTGFMIRTLSQTMSALGVKRTCLLRCTCLLLTQSGHQRSKILHRSGPPTIWCAIVLFSRPSLPAR